MSSAGKIWMAFFGTLMTLLPIIGGCSRRAQRHNPPDELAVSGPGATGSTRLRAERTRRDSRHRNQVAPRPPAPLRPSAMQAETTLDFAYRDKQLMVARQRHGGRIWLPRHRRRRGARLPMVVVLHGIDKSGRSRAHRLMGGGSDLRPTVSRLVRAKRIRPVLMAAPQPNPKGQIIAHAMDPGGV